MLHNFPLEVNKCFLGVIVEGSRDENEVKTDLLSYIAIFGVKELVLQAGDELHLLAFRLEVYIAQHALYHLVGTTAHHLH